MPTPSTFRLGTNFASDRYAGVSPYNWKPPVGPGVPRMGTAEYNAIRFGGANNAMRVVASSGPAQPVTANRIGGQTFVARGVRGLGGIRGMGGMGATGTEIGTKVTATAGAIAGGSASTIAGAIGVAVPVVGIAIAAIVMGVTAWLNRMGPKQKKWTTEIADQATAQLQEIQRVYFSTPYNPANQQAALGATDQMLQAIQDGCGQPNMGKPGQNCISERLVRGGSAPWCPTGTGCDYLTAYRDPIANDPRAAEWAMDQDMARAELQTRADSNPVGGAVADVFGANVGAQVAGAVDSIGGTKTLAIAGVALLGLWFITSLVGDN